MDAEVTRPQMADGMQERWLAMVQEDARTLLDEQLSNLSQRHFEVGRQADRQLTIWLGLVALTLLLSLGMTEGSSTVAGIQLRPQVAAAIAYLLSCVYYYRFELTGAAMQVWREAVRERRSLRYQSLLMEAGARGPGELQATRRDLNGFVPEFPGYLACAVLLKDEATRIGGPLGAYVRLLHYAPLLLFLLVPYILAAAVLLSTGASAMGVVSVIVGLAFTLSGNVVSRFMHGRAKAAQSAAAAE